MLGPLLSEGNGVVELTLTLEPTWKKAKSPGTRW